MPSRIEAAYDDHPVWVRRPRWSVTTEALDRAEREWWREYSDVESEYCWVQTPEIQRFLRGRYLLRLRSAIPPGARVLEIGCGTGWLTRELARSGAAEIHGVEFSPEQIERARSQAASWRERVPIHFHLIERSLDELTDRFANTQFEVLVLHAVLHHLSDAELRSLAQWFTRRLAASEAKALILEPVFVRGPHSPHTLWDRVVDRLVLLPLSGRRLGIRRFTAREAELQERINGRGDSPKETPFLEGELEALLRPELQVLRRTPVLCFSFLAAKNWLLLRISYPLLGKLLMWPYLALVRSVERWVLGRKPGTVWYPLFYLYECEVLSPQTTRSINS